MKLDITQKTLITLVLIIFIGSFASSINDLNTQPKIVDCYDNNYNVIVGSECLEEGITFTEFITFNIMMVIITLLVILGAIYLL